MLAPTVVFDLDGTLIDTAPDLVATLNTIFAHEGLPPVAYESARNMVGGGARAMIERGLKAEGRKLPDAEVASRRAKILELIASLELVDVDAVVLDRAAQAMPTELGTLDAIHLATALLWKDMSHAHLTMATHDGALGLAARAHGLAVAGVARL